MPTKKDFLNFVLEQLSDLTEITHRQMMGEYIIYYRGKIAAYICDNRLFVKPVDSAQKLMPDVSLETEVEGAKGMLPVEDLDDKDFLTHLFNAMLPELKGPTP